MTPRPTRKASTKRSRNGEGPRSPDLSHTPRRPGPIVRPPSARREPFFQRIDSQSPQAIRARSSSSRSANGVLSRQHERLLDAARSSSLGGVPAAPKSEALNRSTTISTLQVDPDGIFHNAPENAPQTKRELLYGPLPRAGDNDYEGAVAKRNEAARIRRRYSTCNEAIGETQRAIPCVRCARHLAEWEGPEEGPRPICVDGASGSMKCTRCSSDSIGKRCVEVTGAARAMVKALEEVAQMVSSDADLLLLHSSQLSVKKAFQQATKASKLPTILQEKADKEKQEYNEECRLLAAEMQAKATSDMASSIHRIADILERGFASLQPVAAGGLTWDALYGDEGSGSDY